MSRRPPPYVALLIWASLTANGLSQFERTHLPPPLRVFIPFENAWQAMEDTLKDEIKIPAADLDRARGTIQTEYHDYISGPLTKDHIAKIGNRPDLIDGAWSRAEYRYDITLQLISARDTVVTVNTHIRAEKRSFLGETSWVDIKSNGRLESQLLTEFGRKVFGSDFALEQPRRGFWEHDPEYAAPPISNDPKVARPERPPGP